MEGWDSLVIRFEKLDILRLDGGNIGEQSKLDLGRLGLGKAEQFGLSPGRNDDRSEKLAVISNVMIK